MPTKIDLRKELKSLYSPSAKQPVIIEVPTFNFLMVDGAIEAGEAPGSSPMFQDCMAALYGAAYTLKFTAKLRKEDPVDFSVMAVEGLWWVEDGIFDIRKPDNWKYTLMILQPDIVTQAMFADALAQLRHKKPSAAVERLRFESFTEGLCVQVMHIGPYATEPVTLDRMHDYAHECGYNLRDKHHEIYLGNPLRADPAKLKTILRHAIYKD